VRWFRRSITSSPTAALRQAPVAERPIALPPVFRGALSCLTAKRSSTITIMTTAFEETLRTLGLVDYTGLASEIVAKKIIELAQQGERDPVRLRDRAVQSLSV
jgi:hypothetical protein